MTNFRNNIISYSIIFCCSFAFTQEFERPFIWVKKEDKKEILSKIKEQEWATSFYGEFIQRINDDISEYNNNPQKFLNNIPFDWSKQKKGKTPPLKTYQIFNKSNNLERNQLKNYLQIGIDCGVLYFLTERKEYGQCALDILYAYIEGITQLSPSKDKRNGGWVYPSDHLREARVVGAQLPVLYDFVVSYLKKGNKPYDIGAKTNVKFPYEKAQFVFRTYAKLAIEHGHTGSNWSVLESVSLIQNALALENVNDRNYYLSYFLKQGTDQQDALPDVAKKYIKEGDVFPETSQYSNVVSEYLTRMFWVLERYNPDLKLTQEYDKILFALDRWNSISYPNGEIIRFGDGKRHLETPYEVYEIAYSLGEKNSVPSLTQKFGPLISEVLIHEKYNKGNVGKRSVKVEPYFTPTRLLWLQKTESYSLDQAELPRTDVFEHAGIYLQRNLSATKGPEYGLMCFVGGGHMVHGHANGMDMELYGLGEVLGVDNGRGKYREDIHENYSRLYAAHNTVVVNGASQGEGGWANLGINKTELLVMEPKPLEKALSPNYSFTITSFKDDKGEKAEALQTRTLALVRTSDKTGYYVDVFRSKSSLSNQYHDYIYHNIGDKLLFLNKDLKLRNDEERYQANVKGDWQQHRTYRNPGWHFFKDVKSSNVYNNDVRAQFEIENIKEKRGYMNLFIIGNDNREYTKVKAPHTFEGPKPYDTLSTPTLVIRQKGAAWNNPFAVVYEPNFNKNNNEGIQSVTKLQENGVFKGFNIISIINGKKIQQYVLIQEKDQVYSSKELELTFKGTFAIITQNSLNKLQDVYIGDGEKLVYRNIVIEPNNKSKLEVYINFLKNRPEINSRNTNVKIYEN
ncbi:heparinase II/III domain-containing protein [Aestuariibaculum suncheonense]|uniref:Heparinase II/III family protein n=1 Tax=Aestuariibaculum suncheonense TaxID=1028745 RepID=A0A8J6QE04_9FLAO|nr:heparinase II/III family protein [Aestuariibaculum suncheonense]MBD0834777.1 heparinase II/III family protein [Aestuariibaculum suncheonense]